MNRSKILSTLDRDVDGVTIGCLSRVDRHSTKPIYGWIYVVPTNEAFKFNYPCTYFLPKSWRNKTLAGGAKYEEVPVLSVDWISSLSPEQELLCTEIKMIKRVHKVSFVLYSDRTDMAASVVSTKLSPFVVPVLQCICDSLIGIGESLLSRWGLTVMNWLDTIAFSRCLVSREQIEKRREIT